MTDGQCSISQEHRGYPTCNHGQYSMFDSPQILQLRKKEPQRYT